MNTEKTMSGLEPYIDDELSLEDKLQMEAQLKRDGDLAETARKLETLNELLCEHGRETTAPQPLRTAVFEKFDIDETRVSEASGPRPGLLGRRSFLIGAGGTLAAGVAGFGVLSTLRTPATRSESAVETFFHDFETYLAKDRAIDIAETSMVRLAQWYGSRLPFRLPPVGSAGQTASLVGGRLCWLLERRLASLSYEGQDGSMVLYIMNADGIAVPEGRSEPALGENVSWHRSDSHTSLVWRSDALLYVMVSQFEVRRLMAEARALVG